MGEYIPSPREHVRRQVELYEATDGAAGYRIAGYPCIILTYRGRKTGAVRKTPLIRVQYRGEYVLVASFGGRPVGPVWVKNLLANPEVMVRDKEERIPARARVVSDPDERAEVWASAVEVFPDYEEYAAMTERVIPIFLCEPDGHRGFESDKVIAAATSARNASEASR